MRLRRKFTMDDLWKRKYDEDCFLRVDEAPDQSILYCICICGPADPLIYIYRVRVKSHFSVTPNLQLKNIIRSRWRQILSSRGGFSHRGKSICLQKVCDLPYCTDCLGMYLKERCASLITWVFRTYICIESLLYLCTLSGQGVSDSPRVYSVGSQY